MLFLYIPYPTLSILSSFVGGVERQADFQRLRKSFGFDAGRLIATISALTSVTVHASTCGNSFYLFGGSFGSRELL